MAAERAIVTMGVAAPPTTRIAATAAAADFSFDIVSMCDTPLAIAYAADEAFGASDPATIATLTDDSSSPTGTAAPQQLAPSCARIETSGPADALIVAAPAM